MVATADVKNKNHTKMCEILAVPCISDLRY